MFLLLLPRREFKTHGGVISDSDSDSVTAVYANN